MTPLRAPGLVALMLSMLVLVAGCTGQNNPTYKYAATFTEKTSTNPLSYQGYVEEGKVLNIYFQANTDNMTKVEVSLVWYDDTKDGCTDSLGLEVVASKQDLTYDPEQQVEGQSPLVVTVTVQPVPKVKRSNDHVALEDYLAGVTNTQGQGNWTIRVTCVDAQPNCPAPQEPDAGNGWVLTVTPYFFEGQVEDIE